MDSKNKTKTAYTYLAVDIGKQTLQLQSPSQPSQALSYDNQGLRWILQQVRRQQKQSDLPVLVIFEATGGYERRLRQYLQKQAVAYRLINPSRVRHYAASKGIKAKTDRIDGAVMLDFAQSQKIQPTPPTDPRQTVLAALVDQRNHIVDQITREQTRLQNTDPTMHASTKRSIRFFAREQERIEKQIRQHIQANPHMQGIKQTIMQVQGLGEVTAWSIIAYMPEITKMSRNEAAALAGLAPFNNDSATQEGKRSIRAGRAKLRKSLYMPALVATRYNPHIKIYYERLIKRGKPHKCAIVAVMRKLILHIRKILIVNQNELA